MFVLILIIILAFIINSLYHKVFHVTYFGCMPLVSEWVVCLVIAAFIVGAFLK